VSEADDFPLMRSVSEGGAAAAGAWGRSSRAASAQSFAAVVGTSFWEGEGEVEGRRKSGGGGRGEVKAPVPVVPQAPRGTWGKK
jgi:hypothetical protein